ncbi:MAG: phosphatidylserine decarboxylase [Myxococcales bacterium]|nr:phosphatidylserine decarboxylase [Myxococcales bacterium]
MSFHRHPAFLRSYSMLPHRLLNRGARWLVRRRAPRGLIQQVIETWIRRGSIPMEDYAPGPYDTVEAFFLRPLTEGARPLGEGWVCPVDGVVMQTGEVSRGQILEIKGRTLSLDRLVNGNRHSIPVDVFEGGSYLTVFLTPHGYHWVHCPETLDWEQVCWIPGRYFPQNADALQHIAGVYEQNERVVLTFRDSSKRPVLLVMVGASLIGGIELDGIEQSRWMVSHPVEVGRTCAKGDRLGCFTFGSTIVLLTTTPFDSQKGPKPGDWVQMGLPIKSFVAG